MKKRMLNAILLCLTMCLIVVTMVSCSEASKINDAVDNTKELTHLDADVYIDLTVGAGNDACDYRVTKDIYNVVLEDGGFYTMEVSSDYGYDDKKVTYFDENYAYLPNGAKQGLTEYRTYNTFYPELINNLLVTVPDELFEEDDNGSKMATSNEANGKYTMNVSFDMNVEDEKEAFLEMFSGFLNSIRQRYIAYARCEACDARKAACATCSQGALNCANCTEKKMKCKKCVITNERYENCSFEIKVVDGYVKDLTFKFDMSADVDMDYIWVEGKIKIAINNPEKEVSVMLPQGYNQYPLCQIGPSLELEDILK